VSDNVNPNPNDDGTGAGTDGNTGDAGTLLGGGDNQVDYAALFSEDEVKTKQEAIASAKAEEARRAALTDEEREKEDIERAKGEAWNAPPPDEYAEFTLPDGHAEGDKEIIAEFIPHFKKLGLSQEKAQALVNLYHEKIMPKNQANAAAQWDAIRSEWGEQAKGDKEYGGEKFEENFHFAKKAMDQFATPELRKAMDEYGFGNHPEVIRLMIRVGKQMSDDPNLPGQSTAGQEKSPYLKYKT